jgi:cell division septal protein FtsQ
MRTKTGKRVRTKRAVKRPQRRRVGKANERKRLFSQFVLPLAICVAILICLGGLGYLGYQKVAASDFFDVKRIEVVGIQRASKEGIANVARMETERTGVWRSDLFELKSKIERIPFVKTASVTRVLPDGLRVQIVERQPVALVTRGGRDYLADADGEILALADHPEEGLPFTMIGWDETKSEKAMRDNTERVKIYQRMVGEWQAANVLSRVQNINLADLREPRAVISDSNTLVSIDVGRENYGENLVKGIKAIVGKGNMFRGCESRRQQYDPCAPKAKLVYES